MGWVSVKVKASSQKHGRCTGLYFFFIFISFDGNLEEVIKCMILCRKSKRNFIKLFIKERVVHVRQHVAISLWINDYTELTFYQLFRLKKETFQSLLRVLLEHDKQQYRGRNYPVQPEKSLLVFRWYLSKQDTFSSGSSRSKPGRHQQFFWSVTWSVFSHYFFFDLAPVQLW
jgi:hypothetical protein